MRFEVNFCTNRSYSASIWKPATCGEEDSSWSLMKFPTTTPMPSISANATKNIHPCTTRIYWSSLLELDFLVRLREVFFFDFRAAFFAISILVSELSSLLSRGKITIANMAIWLDGWMVLGEESIQCGKKERIDFLKNRKHEIVCQHWKAPDRRVWNDGIVAILSRSKLVVDVGVKWTLLWI